MAGVLVFLAWLYVGERRRCRLLSDLLRQSGGELSRVNDRLLDAERLANLGHWERDLVTDKGYWSDGNYRIYGMAPGLHSPRHEDYLARIHPEDRATVLRMRAAIMGENVPYELRYRVMLPDGTIRHVHSHAQIIRDDAGRVLRLVGTTQDITEWVAAEARLRKLTRVIEQTPLSVMITDLKGTIEYVNPHFVEACGYHADELIGSNARILKSGYTSSGEHRTMWDAINAGEVWHGEFHNKTKDDSLIWERAVVAPLLDDLGEITHFVSIKEDITDRKRAELEHHAASERADAAITAKSRFLASMNHELRTPLNAIIGFSECMTEAVFGPIGDDRYQRYAGNILDAGKQLLKLINDILEIANTDNGQFKMNETVIDPRIEVEAAICEISDILSAGGLVLDIDCPVDMPLLFAGELAIYQITSRLLSNAVKFTPRGGHITVRLRGDEAGLFELQVSDTGDGIPAEKLALVLEAFGQIDNELSRKHDGTGLGLALCRSMAELHGGHLDIQSRVGTGTTVTVRFPGHRILPIGRGTAI